MKYLSILTALLALLAAGIAHAQDLTTLDDKAMYTMGYQMGKGLQAQGVTIDVDVYARGIRDAIAGKESPLTPEQAQHAIAEFRKQVQASFQAKQQKEAIRNQAEGVDFMAENKRKPGVLTTASGLQYTIIKEGAGANPTLNNIVKVHYTGRLLNGEIFDSSHQRGTPTEFPLTQVITGWKEGIQLMKPGATYKFFIPPALAYGTRGAAPKIGPNAALIFDVDLIEVKDAPAKTPGQP